jgi:hypothetical protein
MRPSRAAKTADSPSYAIAHPNVKVFEHDFVFHNTNTPQGNRTYVIGALPLFSVALSNGQTKSKVLHKSDSEQKAGWTPAYL